FFVSSPVSTTWTLRSVKTAVSSGTVTHMTNSPFFLPNFFTLAPHGNFTSFNPYFNPYFQTFISNLLLCQLRLVETLNHNLSLPKIDLPIPKRRDPYIVVLLPLT